MAVISDIRLHALVIITVSTIADNNLELNHIKHFCSTKLLLLCLKEIMFSA